MSEPSDCRSKTGEESRATPEWSTPELRETDIIPHTLTQVNVASDGQGALS